MTVALRTNLAGSDIERFGRAVLSHPSPCIPALILKLAAGAWQCRMSLWGTKRKY